MKAARFYETGQPLAVEEVSTPAPGPGEVLVQVMACGVCGSDIHIAMEEGVTPTSFTPIILGHEPAGVVAEIGPGVEDWSVGDRVAVCPFIVCGQCPTCMSGDHQICLQRKCIGIHADGALAEYLCVPADNLVPLPDSVPFEQGAIITDAVATPYHAIFSRGHLVAGESVAVFGCGGLGIHGVQLARLGGASQVIAVDLRPTVLERALAVGADQVVDASREDPVSRIMELTGGLGVDLAVELVGSSITIAQAVDCLRPGGRATVAGLGADPITIAPPAVFVRQETALMASYGFTVTEIAKLVNLVAAGRLDVSGSVSLRLPLDQVNHALERLRDKIDDPIRIVIQPNG